MVDAIDELVTRSFERAGLKPKERLELRKFHRFHRAHPDVLDFLVDEVQLLIDMGHAAFSYASLWHYCRWKALRENSPGDTYEMNDHLTPFYGRAITILHPEFNGFAEFRARDGQTIVDKCFGTRLEPIPKKRPKDYARKLQWEDGQAIGDGWRPSVPHTPGHKIKRRPDVH